MKKILLITLVALWSLIININGFSQILTFDKHYGILKSASPTQDLGSHTLLVDTINVDDTLFYVEFTRYAKIYKYYGIIDSLGGSDIKLKLHCETEEYYPIVPHFIFINNNDISGSIITDPNINRHYVKDTTFNTNETISFDTLRIYSVKFKFDFYFTDPSSVGFSDMFTNDNTRFKVYPNPCENILNIDADGLKRLYDLNGKLLLETKENIIDMSKYQPAMYFLEVNGKRVKVMKE